ncbi:MAG TPA: iron-sulfur cluster assembly scaffold protein [Candidatus Pelagibacter bacterium]|jgi:nitrogen fixation NifU-like protein|nr:iron-sulfur cluster assembly scaffold protein [Pelagibacteraceae bacterium]HJN84127.1 iron-sulfur cluster assembly scaffold protein [Candidatus Pelagibacter bacterium]|tara:strand:- start:1590 stop:1988 length:399 start_codon:yes stop_codon:yes gene_type:complete
MDLEILKIASNTDNNKILKNQTHNSKLKNPICGDEMEVSVKVVKDNIVDFGYQCKSCVYCQASVSLLSRNSINKTISNVKNLSKVAETFFEKENVIFPKEWLVFNKIFNKKNISRKECLLLPFKTLTKALKS